MKRIFAYSRAVLLAAAVLTGVGAQADGWESRGVDVPSREHRAVWMSTYLGAWPTSALNSGNAASQKNTLNNRLDKFRDQNINILYYHVRSMCDANYNSAYEPWSSQVAGTRGGTPAFDPFEYLIQAAHERGIEVYAWVNPYRYSSSTSANPYGGGDLNYENSHPDWLLRNSNQTVLNPGIEAVKQRVVDVVLDIVNKYDVDGIVFDDYFYGQGGTDMSADAAQYNAYKSAGGTLAQADWRRANINEMVKRVHDAIKGVKPHVAFGISPAGVASPPNVESEYGLLPYSGDWQYNQIYSDPLAWFKAGTVDFMSPQIYWPGKFDSLSLWWQKAARKFNRHCYPSVSLTDIKNVHTEEYMREVEETRLNSNHNEAGQVYFDYRDFVNYYQKIFDKNRPFGENLKLGVYPTKALTPLRAWENSYSPVTMSGVAISGNTLTWKELPGMRYTVYAHPKAINSLFNATPDFLQQVVYANSYALPADYADYDWYVAAYDRYGNEYATLGVGAAAAPAVKPTLVYPEDGQKPVDLFDFKWNVSGKACPAVVQVSDDPEFKTLLGNASAGNGALSVTAFSGAMEPGKTYYWRVYANPVNGTSAASEVRSFISPKIAITSPAASATGVSITPTLTWSPAVEGAEYTVEVSRQQDLSGPAFTATTNATSIEVPAYTLISGRQYYARVTAARGSATSTSATVQFATLDRTDYKAPEFVVPATEGATLHCDENITVKPWEGMNLVNITVSASNTFPVRTSFKSTLNDFAVKVDKAAGDIKISSKNLVDGQTYYLRAEGCYYLNNNTKVQETEPLVTTFVYSATAGVSDISADSEDAVRIEGSTLYAPAGTQVTVYTLQGAVAMSAVSAGSVDLSALAASPYLVKAGTRVLKYMGK